MVVRRKDHIVASSVVLLAHVSHAKVLFTHALQNRKWWISVADKSFFVIER
jgi:hypothetical protein